MVANKKPVEKKEHGWHLGNDLVRLCVALRIANDDLDAGTGECQRLALTCTREGERRAMAVFLFAGAAMRSRANVQWRE
jgi:hypothetical protein